MEFKTLSLQVILAGNTFQNQIVLVLKSFHQYFHSGISSTVILWLEHLNVFLQSYYRLILY